MGTKRKEAEDFRNVETEKRLPQTYSERFNILNELLMHWLGCKLKE